MSIIETFTDDHREIDEEFKKFEQAKQSNPEQALDHLKQFQSQLLNHIEAEEEVLFPAYEEQFSLPPDAGVTGAMREEHRFIKQALNTLIEEFQNGQDTKETEEKLLRLLSEHNANEENRLYPELDNALDPDRWNELLEAFELAAHDDG